jgi:site-specific recombinase XerD
MLTTMTPIEGWLVRRVPIVRPRDRRGFYRSPVTVAEYRQGKAPGNKGRKFPPEPLKPREVLALIDACSPSPAGVRDRALIVVLWRGGLRISKALALYPKDVDVDEGELHVLHGKGDRDRVVCIDRVACRMLEEWLDRRRGLGLGRAPVFCVVARPSMGRPLHAVYVRNRLKELAVRAGIEKRVHPHGLRHTHAFELAGERVDLRVIQEQLGHTQLATTALYVNHLNPTVRQEVIRGRAWPTGRFPN